MPAASIGPGLAEQACRISPARSGGLSNQRRSATATPFSAVCSFAARALGIADGLLRGASRSHGSTALCPHAQGRVCSAASWVADCSHVSIAATSPADANTARAASDALCCTLDYPPRPARALCEGHKSRAPDSCNRPLGGIGSALLL